MIDDEGAAKPGKAEPEAPARRSHRRVRTAPVPGSDPTPTPEPPRHPADENDERLRTDRPPHWALELGAGLRPLLGERARAVTSP